MPTAEEFREQLFEVFRVAQEKGQSEVLVKAGDLHRAVGGYPGRGQRMPNCCQVMLSAMCQGDAIVSKPPKGKGATLVIRYSLPRGSAGGGK